MEEPYAALVRSAFEAFAVRDVDSLIEVAHPEIEFLPEGTAALAHGGRMYRGHDGIKRYFRDVEDVWQELQVVPQSFRVAGDHVLVRGRVYARARDGLLIDSAAHWVWRVLDGKLIWGCAYTDEEDAIAALGG